MSSCLFPNPSGYDNLLGLQPPVLRRDFLRSSNGAVITTHGAIIAPCVVITAPQRVHDADAGRSGRSQALANVESTGMDTGRGEEKGNRSKQKAKQGKETADRLRKGRERDGAE